MQNAIDFLNCLASDLPPEERLVMCGFPGDPNTVDPTHWKPRPWAPGQDIPFGPRDNAYVTVSSFGRMSDRTFRRRQSTFAAGRALMIDDVGTKVHPSVTAALRPSAIVETSPGNFQHWLWLDEPVRDQQRFDGLIRAFIAGKLLGADPGMSGVTRVGRLPGFPNGKPAHKGWICKLHDLSSSRRYSIPRILSAFGLEIAGRAIPSRRIPKDIAQDRIRAFFAASRYLERNNMFKRQEADPSGWREIRCPWVDEHTGGANTGAAIREPAEDNTFFGAYRCHHGHCSERGWRELTDWINDQVVEELEEANSR